MGEEIKYLINECMETDLKRSRLVAEYDPNREDCKRVVSTLAAKLTESEIIEIYQRYPDIESMTSLEMEVCGFNYLYGCNLTPSLHACITDKFIWVEELVKFIEPKWFPELVQVEGFLTIRQVIRLGVTHDNLREINRRLYEGLTEREFNNFINQRLDTTVNLSLGLEAKLTLMEYLKSL